jgi:hypothetical protein
MSTAMYLYSLPVEVARHGCARGWQEAREQRGCEGEGESEYLWALGDLTNRRRMAC